MKSTVKAQLFNAGLLVFADHLGKWESLRNARFFSMLRTLPFIVLVWTYFGSILACIAYACS